MPTFWQSTLWHQFGAAIDMLENAIVACPPDIWSDPAARPSWPDNGVVGFWYVAYHTIFFLDYYLSDSADSFAPPLPFDLAELDPAGLLPDRPYTKDELLTYLHHCRRKCRAVIDALTDERAQQPCGFRRPLSVGELLLYNMRHVQHHAGQLNLILRQTTSSPAPRWVTATTNNSPFPPTP
jgi:hypothetical protein